MRITETQMMRQMSGRTMDAQAKIAQAASEVSTGIGVQRASDDPVRWADGMRAKLAMGRRDAHESSVERASSNLVLSETALSEVADGLSRIRELAVLGASETFDARARDAAAQEVGTIIEGMIASANARSLDGEYLLAGSNTTVAPFDATGTFLGNDDARIIETRDGVATQVGVTGAGLTAAAGVDVFATANLVQAALAADDPNATRALLDDLSASIDQVASVRAEAGSTAAELDQTLVALDGVELSLTESLEQSVGADPIEAATWLANLGNQLEASRLVSERIAQLMSLGR